MFTHVWTSILDTGKIRYRMDVVTGLLPPALGVFLGHDDDEQSGCDDNVRAWPALSSLVWPLLENRVGLLPMSLVY